MKTIVRARGGLGLSIVAALTLWSTASLAARLYLYPGNVGAERAFLEDLLARERADGAVGIGLEDLCVGRFDLDGDGQHELFVLFCHSIYCGTAGCIMTVYRRGADGSWNELTELTVSGLSKRLHLHYVDIDDAPGARFRTVRSWSEGQRWGIDPRTGTEGYQFYKIDHRPLDPIPGDPDAFNPDSVEPDVIEGVP